MNMQNGFIFLLFFCSLSTHAMAENSRLGYGTIGNRLQTLEDQYKQLQERQYKEIGGLKLSGKIVIPWMAAAISISMCSYATYCQPYEASDLKAADQCAAARGAFLGTSLTALPIILTAAYTSGKILCETELQKYKLRRAMQLANGSQL